MKINRFTDELSVDQRNDGGIEIEEEAVNLPAAPQEIFTIKIKKSDNTIVKLTVNVSQDTVKDLKERAFQKELH